MGRRKIKMEMVQDMNTVVFSPGGKPFSYGKPNLDAVTQRFMRECDGSGSSDEEGRGNNRPKLKKMNERLDSLNQEIEAEKKRGEKGQEKLESAGDERFNKPIEELTLDELKEYKNKLQIVHGRIQGQANQMQASASLMLLFNNKAPGNLSASDLRKLDHLFRQSAVWNFLFK